ncbi:MAG: FAD-dependent oxidoreductase [Candidatus Aenigmarchaeota archaeon]|nr:FAD-dependent oxidoreductase [Candidatus Aenigmarchaeota archaeon]
MPFAKVTSVRQETSFVKVISLDLRLDFKPGQFVMLGIPGYVDKIGKGPKRAYSIASAPGDLLEFVVKINPVPSFSSSVGELKVGDVVTVDGPFGKFVLEGVKENRVFIASGTGIAPIMSMIRYAVKQENCPKLCLLFGVKVLQECILKKELDVLSAKGVIDVVYCLSREERSGFVHGRVTSVLDKYVSSENEVYICGSPEMVKDVVAVLLSLGVERIFKEQW